MITAFLTISFMTRPVWTFFKLLFDWNPLFPC